MRQHVVLGGGGARLNVVDTGNPEGPAILFVHGWSQSHLCWSRQLDSWLAESHRLVALDLRGHGDSEKPQGAYGDPQHWADDIGAVINALGLERPVLCGWSYGGFVINDYLSCCGQDGISGVNYVAAGTDLGIDMPYKFLGAAWNGLVPDEDGSLTNTVFSGDVEEAAGAMRTFVRRCFSGPLAPAEEMALLGVNLLCPSRVRAELLSRRLENDGVLAMICVPTLVSHGDVDEVVDFETGKHIASRVRGAKLSVYEGAGHALFWDAPQRFNTELAAFAATCSSALATRHA